MNVHIVSNSITRNGKDNYPNDFEMVLMTPIDAVNKDAYIEVLEVCYPLTTKNVTFESCWYSAEIEFNDFKVDKTRQFINCKLKFDSEKRIIPNGIYSIMQLINTLNNCLDEYNIFFSLNSNGKVGINVDRYVEYWFCQNIPSYTIGQVEESYDGHPLHNYHLSNKSSNMRIKLTLSEKLCFMLGFNKTNEEIIFDQNTDNTIESSFLPDPSDGINKIFIYCEEIERTLVGDTSAELLTTVPIQRQGRGSGSLFCFNPVKSQKKLKKSYISSFHITLRSPTGSLIPFDSGTVSIDTIMHYA